MSTIRLPYYDLSSEALQGMRSLKNYLAKCSLGLPLVELVYLRISQINGCAYCLNMHSKSLRESGESQQKLDALAGWRVSSLFSDKERAALEWAESLTDISSTHADDSSYTPLKVHFTDTEISDLTFAISLMNALNRVAIGMRQ